MSLAFDKLAAELKLAALAGIRRGTLKLPTSKAEIAKANRQAAMRRAQAKRLEKHLNQVEIQK